MNASWVGTSPDKLMEPKWHKTLMLSVFFHMAIFSMIFFVPQSIPTRRIRGVVYEVNLVEIPSRGRLKIEESAKAKTRKRLSDSKKVAPAKLISKSKKKKKPAVIAKRVVKTKSRKAQKPKISASELIDQAVSRIERDVKAKKEKDSIAQAISKLEKQVKEGTGKDFIGGDADIGITIRMYLLRVEQWIKGHWSYPVALTSPESQKGLEAVVLVKVKNNGTITKFWFKKRSSNAIFDQSVLKAVERSDPIPPFPEGYRRTYDEIEINFNLKDLEES